jgi:hypothetical protein
MSPAEIALQSQRALRYRVDALAHRVARPAWRRVWEPRTEQILTPGAPHASPLLLGAARIDSVRGSLVEAADGIVAEAERWLEGRVALFGHRELILGRARAFDRDPLTGAPWPERHGRLIDYRAAIPGDPKLVWEVERCQELPLLALAWLLTGEDRFADAAARGLRDWLANHPPGRGVAWANAFEPAMRALSLAIAFDALRDHELLTRDAVAHGLWQHGRWIVGDRSRYSSANNHLVGELVGLLAIAALVPELRDSETWRDLAVDELSREAHLHVLPDGSSPEQAFAYGLFVTDLFLTSVALLELAGRPRPEPLVAALSRAADALVLLVDVGEVEPAFGDDDNARVLLLDGARGRDARGVAASLAACLGHAGARRLSGAVDPTAAILFGRQGLDRFEAAGGASPPGDGLLLDGGLVVLRRSGTRALFDVGPLGYLSIAAHGHADALQLTLSHGGEELVSDPGTGSFLGDPALRRRLRGTAAHATVCVDDSDQSQQGGPFLWTRHAHARLLLCELDEGIAIGEHDGYTALPDPVLHRRAIVVVDDRVILVLDRLVGASEHTFVQSWPLHPALRPHERDMEDVVVASRPDGAGIVLALAASAPSEILVGDDVEWSRRLDDVEPASVVRQRVTSRSAVEMAALLIPVAKGMPIPPASLRLTGDGEVSRATVRIGTKQRSVDVALAAAAPTVRVVV